MKGKFINENGYTLVKLPDSVGKDPALYEFTIDYVRPLYFRYDDGCCLQPDRHEITDMGSIPPVIQWMLPKDRCLLTWIMHDSGYAKGGLYLAQDGERYTFREMSRKELDDFMLVGMEAEGLSWIKRTLAYKAVRLFGWTGWYDNKYRGKTNN